MRPYQLIDKNGHKRVINTRLREVKARGKLPLFAKIAWNKRRK